MKNKIILWSVIALVIIGSVFGIIKLASKSQTPGSGSDTLALTISAINDNENVKGNKNATTTLIEYSDFQCPAPGAYYPILKKVAEDMGSQVHSPIATSLCPNTRMPNWHYCRRSRIVYRASFGKCTTLFSKINPIGRKRKNAWLFSPNTPKTLILISRNSKPTSLTKK